MPPQPAEAEAQQRAALLVDSLSSRLNLREPLSLTVRERGVVGETAEGHRVGQATTGRPSAHS